MRKILRYLKRITKMSFQVWMQYPQDIFASGIGSVVYTCMQLAYFYFLFTAGKSFLGGYTFQEFYTVFFITQTAVAFFFLLSWDNLKNLGKGIEQGTIDLQLIKPIHSITILHFPKLLVNSFMPMFFIQLVLGSLFFFVGIPDVPLWFLPFSFIVIILGWIVLHSTFTISISLLFFLKGFWGMYKTASSFSDLTQYPKDLFPSWIQWIFTFCIPYFMISDPLYKIYKNQLTAEYFLYYLIFFICLLGFSSIFWFYGLGKYEGG